MPPSGVVAGVFSRTDSARPGGVYDPPAGIDAGRMFGVLGFETDEALEERKRDLVYPHRINPLTTGPGLPRYIDGSRTLKGDGNFPYVAERRGVIFIERSLKQDLARSAMLLQRMERDDRRGVVEREDLGVRPPGGFYRTPRTSPMWTSRAPRRSREGAGPADGGPERAP